MIILKYIEKILKVITNILMIIVMIALFFALYNFIQLNFFGKSYVNFFGYTIFDVVSGSMADTININDMIIVKIDDDYKEKDIITYKSGKDFITHRIITIEDDYVITKGDANNTSDNPIDKDIIIGKVIKILPKFGVWKNVIMTPKVLVSVIVTMILFSLAFSFKIKKKKPNNESSSIENCKEKLINKSNDNLDQSKKKEENNEEDIEIL